jgi:putative flippase GtrA
MNRLPIAKLSRSMAVSVITTVISLSILVALTATRFLGASPANVIATVAGIGPSYILNRRWVWKRAGHSNMTREVLPFWTMCLVALVASTAAVGAAADWASGRQLGSFIRTAVLVTANVATFGALWVAQFMVLDRVLFRTARCPAPERL